MDEAQKTAAAIANRNRRNRKRKESDDSDPKAKIDTNSKAEPDWRIGRWTVEEMNYADILISRFEAGKLPMIDGIKLNDFLANILKSKQSRLTKKMKNAKFSSKSFQRVKDYVPDQKDSRQFSELEDMFFHSVQCQLERAKIKFHMQKEWREMFSNFCVTVNQPLEIDGFLGSVEEMERRMSRAKDAERMKRRKLMCQPLSHDIKPQNNMSASQYSIAPTQVIQVPPPMYTQSIQSTSDRHCNDTEEFLSLFADKSILNEQTPKRTSSSFIDKVMSHLQNNGIPFEYVDAWAPSIVPSNKVNNPGSAQSKCCKLCFAGSAVAESAVGLCKTAQPLSIEAFQSLSAFAEYSKKFSFEVGCGLPGRVYETGIAAWEQSVQNASPEHFVRCGGAGQWGIKTVVGIPLQSPSVGRIVVVLYSQYDRQQDPNLVGCLIEEFNKLMPCPRWKLVVDIGQPSNTSYGSLPHSSNLDMPLPAQSSQSGVVNTSTPLYNAGASEKDRRIDEVISLLGEQTPSQAGSPLGQYISSFMSIRLLLLKSHRSEQEAETVKTLIDSYSSYVNAGRCKRDIAVLLARDHSYMHQHQNQQQHHMQVQQMQHFGTQQVPTMYGHPSAMIVAQSPMPIHQPSGIPISQVTNVPPKMHTNEGFEAAGPPGIPQYQSNSPNSQGQWHSG